ncbi:winged helix-turn-helix domain-containing protein [Rhizobium mesoamericanum]|uniref:Two component transcriptional regulator, winged helix family n=1 Tax=Rhizobium mesoamericanum STM3625 TaxID=1211777 RepID=K0PS24_9HYPH|nr:response regulator transcription factor [Rhizobium mesoamericanum]CCM79541.1 Two component transcriptional regulator, winged helix family [Rhizobium mesoamericanum STM3625]
MLTTVVHSMLQLRRHLYRSRYHLLIIDAVCLRYEAIRFCRQVRSSDAVPILMILPPNDPDLVVQALGAGADDCMSPPLSAAEFIARANSLIRRASYAYKPPPERQTVFSFAGFRLSLMKRLLLDSGGQIVDLTAAEFDLLLAFCRNPGRLMGREELLTLTHAGLAGPVARSIDVHISRLRQKIEDDPQRPRLIKTVRLGGYVLTADVVIDEGDARNPPAVPGYPQT